MKQKTKVNIVFGAAIVVLLAIIAILLYAVYYDVTHPQAKPQHGTYAHCEYRTVKGACGKWVTKTY